MTIQTLAILSVMVDSPSDDWYGLELARRADLKSGTIYPALARLEQAGWLSSHWEALDPSLAGRPRRRLYRLTPDGAIRARHALADAHQRIGRSRITAPWLNPGEQPT